MSRSIRVFAEGVLKNVSGLKTWVTAAWKPVSSVRVYESGAWKDVFPPPAPLPPPAPPAPPSPPTPPPAPFSVACDTTDVSGRVIGAGTVVTNAVAVVITGGTAPYVVAWEVANWSNNTSIVPIVNSPTATITTFSEPEVPDDDIVTATFRVTVGDALGLIGIAQVNATFRRVSLR